MSNQSTPTLTQPRWRTAALVLCVCLLSALVATWPLVLFLTIAAPLGTEHEATVPLASLWSLWWNADRIGHGFAQYWDAPIFYPNQGVFTFSEPNLLLGIMVAPLWMLGAPPALIYNIALLGILVLNGVFAYRLARALDLPLIASLVGAIFMVTLPFVAKNYGVLPIMALFGILWALEGFVRFGTNGGRNAAIWAGLGCIASYLSCQQYTLMFVPFAVMAGLVALGQQRYRPAALLWLIGSGLAATIIILALAWPAWEVHNRFGFQRSDQVVQALSAQPGDFLTRPLTAIYSLPGYPDTDTGGLFPGFLLLVLAIVGAAGGIADRTRRAWALYLAGTAIITLLLALGLNLSIAGWQPFATLRAIIPGFSEMRTPFRFAAIGQLCLAMLATLGLPQMQRALGQMAAKNPAVLLAIMGLFAAIEQLAPPMLADIPPSPQTTWTTWLRSQPEGTVIAHVPFPAGLNVADYEIEAWRMFAQIDHSKPMINGYSSYFPQLRTPDGQVIPVYTRFQLAMAAQFPEKGLLCTLGKSLGVNTIVMDQGRWLMAHQTQLSTFDEFLQPIYQDRGVQIYRLQVPAGACVTR